VIAEIIFDLETQKLFSEIGSFNPSKLGVSIMSMYVREVSENQEELNGKLLSFWENELEKSWEIFKKARRIIGFNSIKFDSEVLKPYAPVTFSRLPHFDILAYLREKLGHGVSLDALATATLGREKTEVGTKAVAYWQSGKPEDLKKLQAYCEADVLLTRDVYDYAIKNKMLKYRDKWNTLRSVTVDFSYPQEVLDASRQIGLF